jgi:hypothetical protein
MPPKKAKASAKDKQPDPVPEPEPEPAKAAPQPEPPAIVAEAKPVLPPIVENLLAPEFFATEAQSISLIQGMISIAFSSSRYDYSQTPSVLKKVTISRIVMSPAGAQSLAVRLFAFLDQKGFGAAPKDPKQRQ